MSRILIHGASGNIGNLLYCSFSKKTSNNIFGTFNTRKINNNFIKCPEDPIKMLELQKKMDILILSTNPNKKSTQENSLIYIKNYLKNVELSLNNLSDNTKLVILLSSCTTYHKSNRILSLQITINHYKQS